MGVLGSYVSVGSSEVVEFTQVHHWGRWVHPGWLGSLRCALGVFGFIWFVWFTREHPGGVGFMRVVGIVRGRWVHSIAPWGSLGSSGVVGFTRVRPVRRWVHAASLVSSGVALVYALGFVGFIRCRWVLSSAPCGSLRSSVVVGFTRVCPGDRWVHPGSLGSLVCAMGVVEFIRGGWVHSGMPWGSLGSFGFV